MRTKCAISDAFVRDCVFAYCASVAQYVHSLPAEHCFRLRNNAISDERVRDCALSTHSVFRPLDRPCQALQKTHGSFFDEAKIEVTGGQQRSNFPKIGLFSQKFAIISITMQASKISK